MYQLDHALAECRANQKTFSLFSRLDSVESSNEKALIDIKYKLIKVGMTKVKANSTSTLYTSCMYPRRKDNTPIFSIFIEEIKKIVNWLESNNDGFKAIGIHRMCGTRKTTLTKMVLDDQHVWYKYMKPI